MKDMNEIYCGVLILECGQLYTADSNTWTVIQEFHWYSCMSHIGEDKGSGKHCMCMHQILL